MGLPVSLEGGIIDRFLATPALVSAVPGSLNVGVPTGPTPVPYASIQSIGELFTYMTGDKGILIEEGVFQLAVASTVKEKAERIFLQFLNTFNHKAISASPIILESGKVFTVYITDSRMPPSAEPDKGGNMVYRKTFRMTAKATRVLT